MTPIVSQTSVPEVRAFDRSYVVGGPRPYREAVAGHLTALGLSALDSDEVEKLEFPSVCLVYCRAEQDWFTLEQIASAEQAIVIAVLADLVLGDYFAALTVCDGAVHIDNSSRVIAEVAVAASHGETILPFQVARAMATIASGSVPDRALTHNELEIAAYLGKGLTTDRIARELNFSDRTIRRRLQGLYLKLGATNRAEAITVIKGLGLGQDSVWSRE